MKNEVKKVKCEPLGATLLHSFKRFLLKHLLINYREYVFLVLFIID